LLLVLSVTGGIWLRHRSEGKHALPSHTALPDPPSSEELALLQQIAAHPHDPLPARQLGEAYLGLARPFAALWAYSLALQAAPHDPAATLGLARALAAGLLPQPAIARLHELLARDPGGHDRDAAIREAVGELTELELRTGQPQAALSVVAGAGPAYRASREGALLEGRVREALGDTAGAEAAYRRSIGTDTQEVADGPAWHRLGLLALAQGRVEDARQAFGAARVLVPSELRYWVDFGRACAASSDPKERRRAPELFVKAMNLNPQFAPAHYEAGLWYARQSRWREAIERLQTALQVDPENADARELFARVLEASGQKSEATYQRALEKEARSLRGLALRDYLAWAAELNHSPEAELEVAQIYFKMSRLDEARARLEKARERSPRDASLRERLIAYSILTGHTRQARGLCEAWLKEEPGSSHALWMLGRVAADEKQYPAAVKLYEQALAVEPENPEFLGALGETLLKLPTPDLARATATLARAATAAPDEPRWRASLADALQRCGRIADARRQALRSLDLDPHQGSLYNTLVRLARQERAAAALALSASLVHPVEERLSDELRLWQTTWQHPTDGRAYAALGRFLLRNGELEAAEGQWAAAARLLPGDREARAQAALVRRLRQVQ
jgi:tetratricopeptide (TPR) repeat protein